MKTPLNWKEIELLCQMLSNECRGEHFDRLFVPLRPVFLKREWVLEWSKHFWILSLRNRNVFFTWTKDKIKTQPKATLSAFELELSKFLKGVKFMSAEAVKNDRIALFNLKKGTELYTLRFVMFSAHPELHLLGANGEILLSSKTASKVWQNKGAGKAPDFQVRESIVQGSVSFYNWIESQIREEALNDRILIAKNILAKEISGLKKTISQTKRNLALLADEPSFQKWGDLLKASLYTHPTVEDGHCEVLDYYTDPPKKIKIPCQPGQSVSEQIQLYYKKAKRSIRKKHEESERLSNFNLRLEGLLKFEENLTLENLPQVESLLGISKTTQIEKIKKSSWDGKTFLSKDGFQIWLGRKKEENLELTFRHGKGNDLWIHLRGRPSCHLIIPIRNNKSAPLETLLDAAELCLFYSGGADWSKVEVDYTFRKHVKRIPKSTEVTYSQNKTLIVNPDPERRKRLLESGIQFITPQHAQKKNKLT
jgi:predicted ribosome quality control (RQC) complex YloA/Tae2 family protein